MKRLLLLIALLLAPVAHAATFTIDGLVHTGECIKTTATDGLVKLDCINTEGLSSLWCLGRRALDQTSATLTAGVFAIESERFTGSCLKWDVAAIGTGTPVVEPSVRVNVALPAGYVPGTITKRTTDTVKTVTVSGPKSMVLGAAGVQIVLPPGYVLTVTRRATDSSKVLHITGPRSMVVVWASPTSAIQPSPDGTIGTMLVDNALATWRVDAGNTVLRDPPLPVVGWGDKLKKVRGIVYHQGPPPGTRHWFSWDEAGQTWADHGASEPT